MSARQSRGHIANTKNRYVRETVWRTYWKYKKESICPRDRLADRRRKGELPRWSPPYCDANPSLVRFHSSSGPVHEVFLRFFFEGILGSLYSYLVHVFTEAAKLEKCNLFRRNACFGRCWASVFVLFLPTFDFVLYVAV